MKRRIITIILVWLCFDLSAQVQLRVIKVNNLPDTAILDSTLYDFNIEVENYGNQTFNGNIFIRYKVNNKLIKSTLNTDTASSSITIGPGKIGTLYSDNFVFKSTIFTPGLDIIIIWPEYNNNKGDSLIDSIFLKKKNITRINNNETIKWNVFPVPMTNKFKISLSPSEIKNVRLLSLDGKTVKFWEKPQNIYKFNQLNSGNYMLEVETYHQGTLRKKILIAN